jgi:hypothetical protein
MTAAEVQVTVRNPMFQYRERYGYSLREFTTYVGAILPNPKWVAEDCLCLSTGDPQFPFRVLEKALIVDSTAAISYNTPKSDRNVFQCRGTNGNEYTITREGTQWSCTCTGFGFRRDCKHVQAAKKALMKG